MSGRQYERLYFHHLMKCGGTSFNAWIDRHDPWGEGELVAVQEAAYATAQGERNHALKNRMRLSAFARNAFLRRNVLYDHAPLAELVPKDVLRFTMLREPIERLASQIRDWRRLTKRNLDSTNEWTRESLLHARTMPLKDFVADQTARKTPIRHFVDNYLVRAISENRVGVLAVDTDDAGSLLPVAMEVLEQDFEIVGLLEREAQTREILAGAMGWEVPTDLPALNQTSTSEDFRSELKQAESQFLTAVEHDQRLYEHAAMLFNAQTRPS